MATFGLICTKQALFFEPTDIHATGERLCCPQSPLPHLLHGAIAERGFNCASNMVIFCMHTVTAIPRSLIFEAYLTRRNTFEEKRSSVFLKVTRIVAIHKYFITILCQSYLFLLQPLFANILSKLSQLLNKLAQQMFGVHVRPERFAVPRI